MKSDFRNVLLSVGAVALTLSVGAFVYRASEVNKQVTVNVGEIVLPESELEFVPSLEIPEVPDVPTTVVEPENVSVAPVVPKPATNVPIKAPATTQPVTPVVVPPPVIVTPAATTAVETPVVKPSRSSSAS